MSHSSASQRSFASSKGFSVSSGGKLFIPTNSPVGISSFVPHYIQPVPPTYVTEYEDAYTSPQSKLDFQRGKQAKQQTKPEELKKVVKMVDKGVSTEQLSQWEKLSHLAAALREECDDLLPQSLLTDVHKVADSRVVSSQFEKVCSRLKQDVVRACAEDSEDNHNSHDDNQNGNHQNGHKRDGVMLRAVNQPLQRGQQREEATDTQQDRAMELCLAFIDCADDIKRCC